MIGYQESQRRYKEKNREKLKIWAKEASEKAKDEAFKRLGDKCSNPCCSWINPDGTSGCTDRRCLQVDHVNGVGAKEDRHGCRTTYYRKVLNDTSGKYQLLCANCNWIKRYLAGEWPRKK